MTPFERCLWVGYCCLGFHSAGSSKVWRSVHLQARTKRELWSVWTWSWSSLKIVTQPFPAWANISYTHIHWKSFSLALDCFPIRISRSDPLADISFNQIDLILSLYELKAFVWEVSWRKVIKMSPNLLYKRKEIPLLSSSDHSIKSASDRHRRWIRMGIMPLPYIR